MPCRRALSGSVGFGGSVAATAKTNTGTEVPLTEFVNFCATLNRHKQLYRLVYRRQILDYSEHRQP
jgi:hypothetical protein